MNDRNDHPMAPTPEQEDPVLHRLLSALPSHAPAPGFEDRVLSRVYRPAPAWIRSVRGGVRRAFGTRRVRWWVGGAVVSSAASAVVIAVLAATYWMQVETAWTALSTGIVLGAWRAAITFAVNAVVFMSGAVTRWNLTGPMAWAAAGGGIAMIVASAWGLQRTVQRFHMERLTPDART